jgi:hypothetical protein
MSGVPNFSDDTVLGAGSPDCVAAARLRDCVEFVEARKDALKPHEAARQSLDWSRRVTETNLPAAIKSVCSCQFIVLLM